MKTIKLTNEINVVKETDVIVVGSGPAGSSAAKHAALGGAKVILMDKKSEED